ncbi:uncharacterized protein BDV17DRAFT_250892 [Aspergillus undulatus]|uniref:uncharacterized protein n=1 Tax=Aspergillus undulatus TaxID=1810928 RepID=UPI003CCDA906
MPHTTIRSGREQLRRRRGTYMLVCAGIEGISLCTLRLLFLQEPFGREKEKVRDSEEEREEQERGRSQKESFLRFFYASSV